METNTEANVDKKTESAKKIEDNFSDNGKIRIKSRIKPEQNNEEKQEKDEKQVNEQEQGVPVGSEKSVPDGESETPKGDENDSEEEGIVLINVSEEEEGKEEEEENPSEVTENKRAEEPSEPKEAKEEKPQLDLPEDVSAFIKFQEETGGSMAEYVRLNTDWSKVDDMALVREYLSKKKPYFSQEDINDYISENFTYSEEDDEDSVIRQRKLAYKEAVGEARNHFEGLKEQYYKEVKGGSRLSPEQQEKINLFDKITKQQEDFENKNKALQKNFTEKTDAVFNDDFKGFDFKVGESKFRYTVKDKESVKKTQSNLLNVFSKYIDPKTEMLKDATGYHKALFVAQNADSFAEHFYNQGMADAIKKRNADAKNIDMDGRKTQEGYIQAGGVKVKVVGGESSNNKLKIKKRN